LLNRSLILTDLADDTDGNGKTQRNLFNQQKSAIKRIKFGQLKKPYG
jgi:hypothetical protein